MSSLNKAGVLDQGGLEEAKIGNPWNPLDGVVQSIKEKCYNEKACRIKMWLALGLRLGLSVAVLLAIFNQFDKDDRNLRISEIAHKTCVRGEMIDRNKANRIAEEFNQKLFSAMYRTVDPIVVDPKTICPKKSFTINPLDEAPKQALNASP